MKLKICGMKYPENILELSQLLPDYMGFIFWAKSSRYFEGDIPEIPHSIKRVGVFVDADLKEIISKMNTHRLDIAQLHGNENADFCNALQKENIKVIKVFSIDSVFDFEMLTPFENVCDYFLFDTKGKLPGGNGIAFDWEILKKYASQKPFFLSGGIGIDDIEKIKQLRLPIHAIDINSKFEIKPGLKNPGLINTFKNELSR
jgi:phosphoribosylanthranilate isomerase